MPSRPSRRSVARCLVALFAGAVGQGVLAQDAPAPETALVAIQAGELPLVISSPHGGGEAIPGVPERKGEGLAKGPSGFFTGRDTRSDQLALAFAAAVKERTGKPPYYVVARFHRKYIDANRPAEIAYEHPAAKPVYDAYHDTLARYCKEVRERHGRGLLLDFHGQGSARDTLFRGTRNGKTVTALRERFGEAAHTGPESFFGLLAARGFKVHPQDDGREQGGFTGGYIVGTYGSHAENGIDAIQLEFGGDYRDAARIPAAAATLAEAYEAYAARYLQ